MLQLLPLSQVSNVTFSVFLIANFVKIRCLFGIYSLSELVEYKVRKHGQCHFHHYSLSMKLIDSNVIHNLEEKENNII